MHQPALALFLGACFQEVNNLPDTTGQKSVHDDFSNNVDKGLNGLGMCDLGGYHGYRPVLHFFPEKPGVKYFQALISLNVEQGVAFSMLPGIISFKRLKKGEFYNIVYPGVNFPQPFVAPQDGVVAWTTIDESYTACPWGSGHVRYTWTMTVNGTQTYPIYQ